ncbi:Protein abhd8 [Sparganum proliferum]
MYCLRRSAEVSPSIEVVEIRPGRKIAVYKNYNNETPTGKGILFFIHGVGGSGNIWHKQVEHFVLKGYQTVVMDLAGHGNSPLLANYFFCVDGSLRANENSIAVCCKCPKTKPLRQQCHFEEHFRDVQAVFDKYVASQIMTSRIEGSHAKGNVDPEDFHVIVVAHSYGTSLAVRLVESRSKLVDRLVLISGGAPIPLKPEPGLLSLPSLCLALCMPCIRLGFLRLAFAKPRPIEHYPENSSSGPTTAPVGVEEALAAYRLEHPKSLYNRPTKQEMKEVFCLNAYTLRATMEGQVWPDGTKQFYEKLTLPVLLISGANDKLVSLSEEEEALHSFTCGRLRRLHNSGHIVIRSSSYYETAVAMPLFLLATL